MDTTTDPRTISQPHCQQCGSTDPENVSSLYDTEGYTRCCNERVVGGGRDYMNRPDRCRAEECSHE